MSKLTGETITDEQIREFRSSTEWEGPATAEIFMECGIALSKPRDLESPLAKSRALSRDRLAEIINARNEAKPSRCDECDPSFSCFDGSAACRKVTTTW